MIRLITDSAADLSPELRHQYDIEVLPLIVRFDEESYLDGVDMTAEQFYPRLSAAETLPTTSQLNPDAFLEIFRPHLEAGDEIVGIFLSSELSGTYQSACIAREMLLAQDASLGGRIHLVDSRTVTLGLALLLVEAARLRDNGCSAALLVERVAEMSGRVRLIAVLDTLKYLKMGGRISAATAFVGGILGINPLVAVVDGKVEAAGKVRGRPAAYAWMAERLAEEPPVSDATIVFGHANTPGGMAELRGVLRAYDIPEIAATVAIGSVVGTYTGPGAVGIAWLAAQ